MKILFELTTGEIYYAVKDIDWVYFTHTTNIPLKLAELPETEDNRQILADVWETQGRRNKESKGKYYIRTEANNAYLEEREGWIEWSGEIYEEKRD